MSLADGLLLAGSLSGAFFLLTRVLAPRLAGLPFGLAGRTPWGVALANAVAAAAAGVFLGWVTELSWGWAAGIASGWFGVARLAHQLRLPRAIARVLRHPRQAGELASLVEEARPKEADRGTAAGQTWALWVLGTVESLQDAGDWKDEAALLGMLDNYPLNPVLSTLHRTMGGYYLLRQRDREKARWALTMDLAGASEGVRARVEALLALLDAVEGNVESAGRTLDHWMRPAGWATRIREMARVNVLAAEDDRATRVALDRIEVRWGASGTEELRRLGGPAASWLE